MVILPGKLVEDDVARGALVEIKVRGLAFERTLGLVIPARRYLSATVRAFLGVLAEGLAVELPGRCLLAPGASRAGAPRREDGR